MASALPHGSAPAELSLGHGSEVLPFARQTVELTKQAYIQLKWAASYWKAQYDRVAAREAALKQEVVAQEAQIRDLTHRLYGKKSEKGAGKKPPQAPRPRRRGQQKGRKGPGRTAPATAARGRRSA